MLNYTKPKVQVKLQKELKKCRDWLHQHIYTEVHQLTHSSRSHGPEPKKQVLEGGSRNSRHGEGCLPAGDSILSVWLCLSSSQICPWLRNTYPQCGEKSKQFYPLSSPSETNNTWQCAGTFAIAHFPTPSPYYLIPNISDFENWFILKTTGVGEKEKIFQKKTLPKVGSGVVFRVELFVRKGSQVDVSECRKHLS